MAGTKTIDDLINQSQEPADTGKSIDDIINTSNLAQFLSTALADRTNVDANDPLAGQSAQYQARMPEIRQSTYEDISGVSNEELLSLIMGTTGGGAKSLADVAKQIFKKAPSKTPYYAQAKPTVKKDHDVWKFFTPDQKKELVKLYEKPFNYERLKKVKEAEKRVVKNFYEKKVPGGQSVADYMKLEEGRTTLPMQTLPELVSLLLKRYSK